MPVIKGNNKDNRLIGQSDVFGVTNSIYGYGGNDRLEVAFTPTTIFGVGPATTPSRAAVV